jgi:hypothetical protein
MTMNRREFLKEFPLKTFVAVAAANKLMTPGLSAAYAVPARFLDTPTGQDWLARWQKSIIGDADRSRYCDKEMGEELGWLVSPFLNGFYYGHLATGDTKWVERLVDWTDATIRRGIKEPDGFTGWPKAGTGGLIEDTFYTDSLLGEAMLLRPVVLMADHIRKTPALSGKWGGQAGSYLTLAEATFEKWDARGCWREVKHGGLWIVPAFGIDQTTGTWTSDYDQRKTSGFSNPANKQNAIARWLLALHDATGKSIYRERAEAWFQLMKSRMRTREDGKYFVWNYWDPAGPWDYKPDGSTRHWVGVHPNGGYYAIDVEGITAAFEHGLVFKREDINRLIATNRDYMWNQQMNGTKFQRIDGGAPDPRWKNSPGVLWTALVPQDDTLRKIFVANHDPASWGGLAATPWFLSLTKT